MNLTPLVYFSLFLIAHSAYGQKTDLELILGPNLGSLRGNEILTEYHKSKLGLSGGLAFSYHYTTKFSMGAKFLYENKGSKGDVQAIYADEITGEAKFYNIKFSTTYNYVSVPVTVKYSFGEKIKVLGELGLFTSYLMKEIEEFTDIPNNQSYSQNNTDRFKKIDFGFSAGCSILFPINEKVGFSASLLNNFGLINISDVPVSDDGSIKTNCLNLLFGVNYKLKGEG